MNKQKHTREFLIACLYDMAAQPMPPDEGDLRVMREAADMLVVTAQPADTATLTSRVAELEGALSFSNSTRMALAVCADEHELRSQARDADPEQQAQSRLIAAEIRAALAKADGGGK